MRLLWKLELPLWARMIGPFLPSQTRGRRVGVQAAARQQPDSSPAAAAGVSSRAGSAGPADPAGPPRTRAAKNGSYRALTISPQSSTQRGSLATSNGFKLADTPPTFKSLYLLPPEHYFADLVQDSVVPGRYLPPGTWGSTTG